ncbi:hypothetical protein GCHA_0821 [Paraglaciecola chathamensis S18K6]|uniref:Uncharacterized protein n=1 Tax=Paraglaciecola chathamensis S18K6 TaxID=1127672 RepID=A0AAV3UUW8_9ALTE|nr:hypothetical protein GCHA_0821 [Paraglaciecola chathamensis S18K6]
MKTKPHTRIIDQLKTLPLPSLLSGSRVRIHVNAPCFDVALVIEQSVSQP